MQILYYHIFAFFWQIIVSSATPKLICLHETCLGADQAIVNWLVHVCALYQILTPQPTPIPTEPPPPPPPNHPLVLNLGNDGI